jgi:hypothetical protein
VLFEAVKFKEVIFKVVFEEVEFEVLLETI